MEYGGCRFHSAVHLRNFENNQPRLTLEGVLRATYERPPSSFAYPARLTVVDPPKFSALSGRERYRTPTNPISGVFDRQLDFFQQGLIVVHR